MSFLMVEALIMFGCYFVGMSFASVQIEVMEMFHLNVFKYNLLIDASIILSVPMSIVTGFGADKLGFRVSLVLGTIGLSISQSIVCLGFYLENFWIVFLGKTFLGTSQQALIVVSMAILNKWFHNYEINFANSYNLSFARLGTSLADILIPIIFVASNYSLFVS